MTTDVRRWATSVEPLSRDSELGHLNYLCGGKSASMKILMVCLGNICRSPLAEGILRHKAAQVGLSWEIESAGTNGYHVGECPHHLSQKVARLNGIDISHQRARNFTANDFAKFDLIYAMAGDVLTSMKRIAGNRYDPSRVKLLLDEQMPGCGLDVPDPWYGEEPGYHEVYKLIDEACDVIIQRYSKKEHTSI